MSVMASHGRGARKAIPREVFGKTVCHRRRLHQQPRGAQPPPLTADDDCIAVRLAERVEDARRQSRLDHAGRDAVGVRIAVIARDGVEQDASARPQPLPRAREKLLRAEMRRRGAAEIRVHHDRIEAGFRALHETPPVADHAGDSGIEVEIAMGDLEGMRIDIDDRHVLADARQHRAERAAGAADQDDAPGIELRQQAEDRMDVAHQAYARAISAALVPAPLAIRNRAGALVRDNPDFAKRIGAARDDRQ